MNPYLFSYLAEHPYVARTDILFGFDNWRARLAGPIITGWMTDVTYKICEQAAAQSAQKPNFYIVYGGYKYGVVLIIFGLYHAAWLFLLFSILILHRKDALLIMLGVFSGLMYNLTPPAGLWFYPWDMPTMFFFTWACLLYDKRRMVPLMVIVWLGSLFKETTLCCALLILLGEHWTWKKRIAGFAATAFACLLTRKLLMAMYGIKTMFFALNNTSTIHGLISQTWSVLDANLHSLFSFQPNHVAFTNAGALLIMMLIPWRTRRDVIFKILALAFIMGQFLCGIIFEFRIWYEMLPLGWMLISETLGIRCRMVAENQFQSAPINRRLQTGYWFVVGGLGVVALTLWAVAR